MSKKVRCPTSGCDHELRKHCSSRTCNWMACAICKHYGIPGRRWALSSHARSAGPDVTA